MASSEPPPDEQPPPPSPLPGLPYKTWVLKVSIHCQACKRKVKKVLRSIEGVYITDIDEKQHKVTVTGNVEPETLIKKLIRSGKNAEMWHKKSSFKEKKSKSSDQKPDGSKNNENSDDDDDNDDNEEQDKPPAADNGGEGQKPGSQKTGGTSVRFDLPPPGNVPVAAGAVVAGQGPKKKKKKKKKKSGTGGGGGGNAAAGPGSNSAPGNVGSEASKVGPAHVVDQGNLGHPYPHPNQYPPSYAPPQQGYVVSYSAAHPSVGGAPTYYCMPSSPYTYAYTHAEVHSMRCRPLDSFEILSDENPNACYIM